MFVARGWVMGLYRGWGGLGGLGGGGAAGGGGALCAMASPDAEQKVLASHSRCGCNTSRSNMLCNIYVERDRHGKLGGY